MKILIYLAYILQIIIGAFSIGLMLTILDDVIWGPGRQKKFNRELEERAARQWAMMRGLSNHDKNDFV